MAAARDELPVPPFYAADNAASWGYRPDAEALPAIADDWRRRHDITHITRDAGPRVCVLLLHLQKDFCLREGSLYAGGRDGNGAVGDSGRIAGFIYRNLRSLAGTTAVFDAHFLFQTTLGPLQMPFAALWTRDGKPVPAHTFVTTDEIRSGAVEPDPVAAGFIGSFSRGQVLANCDYLDRLGQSRLYLLPRHCTLGGDGHSLVGVIHEARMFHALVRGAQPQNVADGAPALAGPPTRAVGIGDTRDVDALVVAGQIGSHCFRSFNLLSAISPSLIRKTYVLSDCVSAVTLPDGAGGFTADYTPVVEDMLQKLSAAGMRLVKSTEPMDSWL